MTTYRAAYINAIVFTGPEHAALSDEALRAEALAVARRAGVVDETTDDEEEAHPGWTLAAFERDLCIGDWKARN